VQAGLWISDWRSDEKSKFPPAFHHCLPAVCGPLKRRSDFFESVGPRSVRRAWPSFDARARARVLPETRRRDGQGRRFNAANSAALRPNEELSIIANRCDQTDDPGAAIGMRRRGFGGRIAASDVDAHCRPHAADVIKLTSLSRKGAPGSGAATGWCRATR
jgi:hypothetical protein